MERGNGLQHVGNSSAFAVFIEYVGHHESHTIANGTATVLYLQAYLGIEHLQT